MGASGYPTVKYLTVRTTDPGPLPAAATDAPNHSGGVAALPSPQLPPTSPDLAATPLCP
jgi:hypothetical protein